MPADITLESLTEKRSSLMVPPPSTIKSQLKDISAKNEKQQQPSNTPQVTKSTLTKSFFNFIMMN